MVDGYTVLKHRTGAALIARAQESLQMVGGALEDIGFFAVELRKLDEVGAMDAVELLELFGIELVVALRELVGTAIVEFRALGVERALTGREVAFDFDFEPLQWYVAFEEGEVQDGGVV